MIVVAGAALALPGFARAGVNAPLGQTLAWGCDFENTDSYQVFGANTAIDICGQIAVGVGDDPFGFPTSSIYVVPAGVSDGQTLDDRSGAPNVVTAYASGGLFDDETIAITWPSGKTGTGKYAIVYDEDQNGKYDAGTDYLLDPAFSVEMPATIPPIDPALTSIKDAAHNEFVVWNASVKSYQAYLKLQQYYQYAQCAAALLEGIGGAVECGIDLLIDKLKENAEDAVRGALGLKDVKEEALNFAIQQVAHYNGIWQDPPDAAYQQIAALGALDHLDLHSANPTDEAAVDLGNSLGAESELAGALLHAIERYQGAAAANDADWALQQARAAKLLAGELNTQLADTASRAAAFRDALSSDSRNLDVLAQNLAQEVQRWKTSGLSDDERRALLNAGASSSQIDSIVSDLETMDTSSFTTASLSSQLSAVQTEAAGAQADLGTFTSQMDALVTNLDSFAPPSATASAGGPYTATAGDSLTLAGSDSIGTSSGCDLGPEGICRTIASESWDLNGDGVFGDATGPTPTFTVGGATRTIGYRVTDSAGNTTTAYALLTVNQTNQPPTLTTTPSTGTVDVLAGTSTTFTVAASDPDGDPVTTTWSVDGTSTGTGSSFTYDAPSSAVGMHLVEVTADDGHGGTTSQTWGVNVSAPDADGDGWNTNVDCNDNNAAVNPGAYEIVGNGIDDDCNAATPDTGSPPDAAFTHGAAIAGQAVSFADGSTDPNHDIVSWSWTFGDVSAASTDQNPTHTYAAPGTYTVTLTVTDSTNQSTSVSHDVVVSTGPSPSFTFSPPTPVAAGYVSFTDTSTDPAAAITAWSWDFGDTGTSTDQNPVHVFAAPGSYDVTLTITDALGLSQSATQTVTIGVADPATAPHALFDPQGSNVNVADGTRGATVTASSGYCCGGHDPQQMLDAVIGLPWATQDTAAGKFATIKLTESAPVLIDAVQVQPRSDGYYDQGVKGFAVDVSTDGTTFTNVLNATTTYTQTLQTFALPTPAEALYVRYRPLTNWGACCNLSTSRFTVLTNELGSKSVSFHNLSTNAVSYKWAFGDGGTSTDAEPSHTYASAGTYTVTLTATSADGRVDTYSLDQIVLGPTASFSYDPASPPAGFPVTFTDQTNETGGKLVSFRWDFGDGSTSTAANPVHTFATAGIYTVKETVTDDLGFSETATRAVTVGASGGAPIALFDAQPQGGAHDVAGSATGATIDATQQGCHPPATTLIDGDFADASYCAQWWSSDRSSGQRVLVTLAKPELLDAFRILGPGGGWWEWIKDFDVAVSSTTTDPSAFTTVLHGTTTQATTWQEFDFPRPYLAKYVELVPSSVWVDSACCYSAVGIQLLTGFETGATTVTFKNLSQNATSYSWDFGDGGTSTEASPTHTYAAGGSYTVTLTATGSGGTTTYSATESIDQPDFTWSPGSPGADDYVQFTDTSPAILGALTRSWSFGDGTTSTVRSPVHHFPGPGTYNVTLTVTDSAGVSATRSKAVTIAGPALHALFTPAGDANAAQLESGASVVSFSSEYNGDHSPQAMLDRLTDGCCPAFPWATGSGTGLTTTQFAKIALVPGAPWLIDHVDVMPRPCCESQRVKDFEIWVSSTTADDAAFTKVLDGRTVDNGNLQRFDLPEPVLAKYILYKPLSNWGHDSCCISTQQLRASSGQVSEHTVSFTNLSRGATSYSWDFGDGTSSTEAAPTHTYAAAGDYTVTLTASDGAATSTFSLVQHVLDPLTTPVVADDNAAPNEGDSVAFTATPPSNLPDGTAVNYHWSWGDGSSLDTATPTAAHQFGDNGTYTVTVTVTDKYLRTVSGSKTVAVANVAPTVDLGADRTIYEHSFLSAGYSYRDPGANDGLYCDVDYGDGTAPALHTGCGSLYHWYPTGATTYTLQVTIHDKDGGTGTDSVKITTLPRAQDGYAATDFTSGAFPGSPTPVPFSCCGPVGVVFDSTNHLYVADDPDGYIYKFGADGGAPDAAHRLPTHVGCNPTGLAFSKTGRLYVARQGCGEVDELDPATGAILRVVARGIPCVTGLATDPISGDLIGTTVGCDGYLYRIDTGEDGSSPSATRYTGWIGSVDGITIGPDGTMWLEDGGWLVKVQGTNQPNAGATQQIVQVPYFDGVAISASTDPSQPSYLYANRNDGIITKIDLSGSTPRLTDIYKGGTRGDFVAVGPDGCLYATQTEEVVKVTFADGTCGLASTSAAPQLSLAPQAGTEYTGSPHAVTATLSNVDAPAGIVVTFTVTGANPQSGTAVADAAGKATFTYTGTSTGDDAITASATAGTLPVVSNTVAVTWQRPPNSPPVAGEDHFIAVQGEPLTVDSPGVLANDSDPDGNTITAVLTTGPAHGSLALSADGSFTYTPAPGFRGTDSFTYTAFDGSSSSQPATVTISVDGTPTAVDDSAATHMGTPVTLDLTANDTDPENEPLTIVTSGVTAPAHGTFSGGVYTPDAGYVGDDSFRYTVTDGLTESPPATVTIHVTDTPPAGVADEYSTHLATPLHVSAPGVLANDGDPDGDPLRAVLTTGPADGTLVLAADGSFTYTPGSSFVGDDAFTYTPNDGGLGGAPVTVTLHVTDQPPVTVDDSATLIQGGSAGGNVLANDSDPDGDPLTAALEAGAAHGTVSLSADGSFTYTPEDSFFGTDSFTYLATDGALATPATVTFTVKPRNRPPVVSLVPAGPVDEGAAPLSISAIASDPDVGQTLTYTWSSDLGTILGNGDTAAFSADDGPATANVAVDVCDDGEPQKCTSATEQVVVNNVAPAVVATAAPTTQYWGLPVHFAAGVTDPSGADTAYGFLYEWSFGDLLVSQDNELDHVYTEPGTYSPAFSATDKDGGRGEGSPGDVTIRKRPTTVAFTAPTTQAFGPTTLSAQLADSIDATTAHLAGQVLTFVIGGRTFTATTDDAGVATVTPAPFVLSGSVTVSYAGNRYYLPSSSQTPLEITNAFGSANGFFAVGDGSATANATVTYWGAQWWKSNIVSGGAPASFKGFVQTTPLTGCGASWTTDPGNSSGPPATVGPYLAVVVPSRVTQSGSTISGNTTRIVAVKTASGYGPAPGHAGTGKVVGTVC